LRHDRKKTVHRCLSAFLQERENGSSAATKKRISIVLWILTARQSPFTLEKALDLPRKTPLRSKFVRKIKKVFDKLGILLYNSVVS